MARRQQGRGDLARLKEMAAAFEGANITFTGLQPADWTEARKIADVDGEGTANVSGTGHFLKKAKQRYGLNPAGRESE